MWQHETWWSDEVLKESSAQKKMLDLKIFNKTGKILSNRCILSRIMMDSKVLFIIMSKT